MFSCFIQNRSHTRTYRQNLMNAYFLKLNFNATLYLKCKKYINMKLKLIIFQTADNNSTAKPSGLITERKFFFA